MLNNPLTNIIYKQVQINLVSEMHLLLIRCHMPICGWTIVPWQCTQIIQCVELKSPFVTESMFKKFYEWSKLGYDGNEKSLDTLNNMINIEFWFRECGKEGQADLGVERAWNFTRCQSKGGWAFRLGQKWRQCTQRCWLGGKRQLSFRCIQLHCTRKNSKWCNN